MSTTPIKQIIKKVVNNEKLTINGETIDMLEYILNVFYTRIVKSICLVIQTNKRKTIRESDLIKVINIIYKIDITPNEVEVRKQSLKMRSHRSFRNNKRHILKSTKKSPKSKKHLLHRGGGDDVLSTIKLDPVETNLIYLGFCGGNYSECMPAKISCCTDCRSALSAYGSTSSPTTGNSNQTGGGKYYLIPEDFIDRVIQKHCSRKQWTKKTLLLLRSIGVYYIVNILIKSVLFKSPKSKSLTLRNIRNFVYNMN